MIGNDVNRQINRRVNELIDDCGSIGIDGIDLVIGNRT